MTRSAEAHDIWGEPDQLVTVARNVGSRYLAIATDAAIGLVILPFNVHHLGAAAWGLWMLTASVTTYFSVLDLGYGGSIVKFVAQYRARRDARALNEILSTLFALFGAVGLVAYGVFVLLALHLTSVFRIAPDQIATGRALLFIIGAFVSLGFPFSVFGGVMNGFQRYDLNNIVGVATSLVVAVVNVVMLSTGYTLVQMVAATTVVRIAGYFVYRLNAYRVFPALSLSVRHIRLARLREVTGFSVYMSIIDWSNKLNYSIDAVVIGAFLSSSAVALWTVPQRLAEMLQRMTNQLNGVLLPVIVDSDTSERADRLRTIFVQGTRLSCVLAIPTAAALFVLAGPLIRTWVGAHFEDSIVVTQILVSVVAIRVSNATATTVLKGAGRHRLLAFSNAGSAIANVALSLLWIRKYGLIGQAMGTLVPVAVVALLVLWPAACRRVGLGVMQAFWTAVWPTLWPLAVMTMVLLPVRAALPPAAVVGRPLAMLAIAAAAGIGGLVYVATFLVFAVKRDERHVYLAKAGELARWRRLAPAA